MDTELSRRIDHRRQPWNRRRHRTPTGRLRFAVVVLYRDSSQAAASVVDGIGRHGGRAVAFRADMADPPTSRPPSRSSTTEFGRLDAVVNNAAVMGVPRRFVDVDANELQADHRRQPPRRHVELPGRDQTHVHRRSVDAAAASSTCRPAPPGMAHLRRASPTRPPREASRASASGSHRSSPGKASGSTSWYLAWSRPTCRSRRRWATAERLVPLGRAGRPEEIAETIAWLVSDSASFVIGAAVRVSGGAP